MLSTKSVLKWLLAAVMVLAGANHFRVPEAYAAMMPPQLPAPDALVLISGVFEILGGIGLLVPRTQRFAAWGLIALFIAVFPANLHMAVHHLSPPGTSLPAWVLWARLPFQIVFIGWAWMLTRPPSP